MINIDKTSSYQYNVHRVNTPNQPVFAQPPEMGTGGSL